MERPVCDKCGGLEFEEICIDKVPTPTDVPASKYFRQKVHRITLEMVYHQYKAVCETCGAEYFYTK